MFLSKFPCGSILPTKMTSLRSKDNPIFGFPSPLPPNQLPTHSDVLKLLMLYHEQLKESTKGRFVPVSDVCSSVAQDLMDIWKKASLPTMQESSICRKVRAAYDEAKYCEKKNKSDGVQT